MNEVDKTVTTCTSGRVVAQYRHLGLYTSIVRLILEELKMNYPCLKKYWSVKIFSEKLVEITEKRNGRLLHRKVSRNITGQIHVAISNKCCNIMENVNLNLWLVKMTVPFQYLIYNSYVYLICISAPYMLYHVT